ncbi:MAG: hypothetical protein SPJ19_01530 [Candidatus Borkfalkiaceae bacterium]|nr:hypothetical protein [Christensenellaceae bacterium]
MNRTKRLFLLLFICVIATFSLLLTACGGKVEGTYKFKTLSYQEGGMTIELEAGEKFMGMITLTEDFAVLTLNADGSAVMTMKADGEETSIGTWTKAEKGKIVLTFDGESQTVACDGKKIEIETDGVKVVLKK